MQVPAGPPGEVGEGYGGELRFEADTLQGLHFAGWDEIWCQQRCQSWVDGWRWMGMGMGLFRLERLGKPWVFSGFLGPTRLSSAGAQPSPAPGERSYGLQLSIEWIWAQFVPWRTAVSTPFVVERVPLLVKRATFEKQLKNKDQRMSNGQESGQFCVFLFPGALVWKIMIMKIRLLGLVGRSGRCPGVLLRFVACCRLGFLVTLRSFPRLEAAIQSRLPTNQKSKSKLSKMLSC
jgi:hypothetical protein